MEGPPRQPRGLRALDRGDHLFARLSRGGELGGRGNKKAGRSAGRTDIFKTWRGRIIEEGGWNGGFCGLGPRLRGGPKMI